jgi:transposase
MRSYSIDLRERVVAACDRGEGTREQIARRFCVSVAWVYKLLARRRQTGSIAPKPHGGGQPPAFHGESAERLRKAVEDCPDATLEELREAAGVGCGTSAVFRALRRLGLPRKKSPSGLPSRTALS